MYDRDGLRTEHNHDFMEAPDFQAAYQRGVKATGTDYHWEWRVHVGLWAAKNAARLSGDFVECGVAKGFLSSAIMQALNWNATGRTFYLLDTFAGIDPTLAADADEAEAIEAKNRLYESAGIYAKSANDVIANFSEWRNARVIAGRVPDTLPQITSHKIAFAHIDMNHAVPEIAALEYLWPRLVSGAHVLLDDYAYDGYGEQKNAMDALSKRLGLDILSLPTGQGLIVRPPHHIGV